MIRTNESFHNNTGTANPAVTRDFSKIMCAMAPFWEQYALDAEMHTARGLLPTHLGIAHEADISFDDEEKNVTLMVRVPLANDLDTSHEQCFSRLQNRPHGLASVILDREDRLLLLISCSVLPDPQTARIVISRVVAHLLDILEDEDLQRILN